MRFWIKILRLLNELSLDYKNYRIIYLNIDYNHQERYKYINFLFKKNILFKDESHNHSMKKPDLNNLKRRLREFARKRDWDQFHSPKNLSMALSVEVAEIVEHFQWLTEEQSKDLSQDKKDEVETELADTLIYLIRLADTLDVDLLAAALKKIEVNERKYPVDKSKGNAKKYNDF